MDILGGGGGGGQDFLDRGYWTKLDMDYGLLSSRPKTLGGRSFFSRGPQLRKTGRHRNPGKQHVEKFKWKLDDHLAKIPDIPEQHISNSQITIAINYGNKHHTKVSRTANGGGGGVFFLTVITYTIT